MHLVLDHVLPFISALEGYHQGSSAQRTSHSHAAHQICSNKLFRQPLSFSLCFHYIRLLAIGLIGVMIIRMWLLILAFATISPTMFMNTFHLISSGFVRLSILEVCQSISLYYGFINRPDLSGFQLHPDPTLQPIHVKNILSSMRLGILSVRVVKSCI